MLVPSDLCLNLYDEIYRLTDRIYTVYYSPAGIEIASSSGVRMSMICTQEHGASLRLIIRIYVIKYSEAGVYEDLYGEVEFKGSEANRFLEALRSLLKAERLSMRIRERYLEK